jgi:hypothetical protein
MNSSGGRSWLMGTISGSLFSATAYNLTDNTVKIYFCPRRKSVRSGEKTYTLSKFSQFRTMEFFMRRKTSGD